MKNVAALRKNSLPVIGVVAMIYSFVAAGAFGIEEMIPVGGPGMTIILLSIFPFIWGYPLSSMISELGSLYPSEGGIYSWARESMGEFWGWVVGFWAAITTWLCQAQYCALIIGYLSKFVSFTETQAYLFKILIVLIFTIVNIIGIKALERMETVIMILVLIAFAAVTIVGLMHFKYNPMQPIYNEDEGIMHSIGGSIAIVIWMYCGYECMSNMAEELEDPQIIPKAMGLSQPLIALSYILPTFAGLAALGAWTSWSMEKGGDTVGYADVLIRYIGPWAGIMFIIIAMLSNCAILSSYIAHGSRAFFVMSDDHMFPRGMCKVDRRGIPTVAILLLAVFTIITCRFDFTTLVMATTPIQLYLYLILVVCVIRLRKEYPIEIRKKLGLYVMPGGTFGLVLFSVLVTGVSLAAIVVDGTEYFLTGFVVLGISLVLYLICKWIYKGRAIDDEKAFPINPKTKLGLGDMIHIGLYLIVCGAMSFFGSILLYFYDVSQIDYYVEEYETGLFSDFYSMIAILRWIGLAMCIVGVIVYIWGRNTEGETYKALKPLQKRFMDNKIREFHKEL